MICQQVGPGGSILLALLGGIVGCSSGPAFGTVNGEVTLDGQPLKEGRVQLTPSDGQGQTAGEVITDGRFSVRTRTGSMKVEINASKVIGKEPAYQGVPNSPMNDIVQELIPKRYNAQTELTIDVKPGSQAVKYELKSR